MSVGKSDNGTPNKQGQKPWRFENIPFVWYRTNAINGLQIHDWNAFSVESNHHRKSVLPWCNERQSRHRNLLFLFQMMIRINSETSRATHFLSHIRSTLAWKILRFILPLYWICLINFLVSSKRKLLHTISCSLLIRIGVHEVESKANFIGSLND